MKKALYKVPNGKLLKIFLEDHEGKIAQIKITGDFFTYPEEHIETLENFLIGTALHSEVLTARIHEFLGQYQTEFFGIDESSLVSTILQAYGISPSPNRAS